MHSHQGLKYIFLIVFLCLSFPLASAILIDNPNLPLVKTTPIVVSFDNTTGSVNNSEYLQGYTPATLYTYYTGLFDLVYAPLASLANYLPLAGGTMAGDIDMDGNNINNVGDIQGDGTGSWFNQTLLISGDHPVSTNSDATLVIQSEVNYISCINLTEGGNLGFQICYDGTGGGELIIKNMNGATEYMTIDRDDGGIVFHNETTFVNITVTNITTTTITTSGISGRTAGLLDMRGDPWILSEADFQILENLLVGENITVDGYINGINISNLSNEYVPYTGATSDVNIGAHNYITNGSIQWHEQTGIQNLFYINPLLGDGFRMEYWYDFEAANDDWLIFHKTDGNDANPDGGIGFMMSNSSGYNKTVLKIDGGHLANFTNYDITTTGNITANWFNGRFNWTSGDTWNSFNGNTLTFNDSMLSTIYYNASAIQVITGTGAGTLADIQTYNRITYNVTEVLSDYDLRVNFTGITDFTTLLVRHKCSDDNGHVSSIEIWDYSDSNWEGYGYLTESVTSAIKTLGVYDASDHIQDGIVQVRFFQEEVGNALHIQRFDWVSLSKGYGTPVGQEIDPDFNHWLGDPVFLNNINATNINFTTTGNVTASYFIGDGSQLTGIEEPLWSGNLTNVAFTNTKETFAENITFSKNITVTNCIIFSSGGQICSN